MQSLYWWWCCCSAILWAIYIYIYINMTSDSQYSTLLLHGWTMDVIEISNNIFPKYRSHAALYGIYLHPHLLIFYRHFLSFLAVQQLRGSAADQRRDESASWNWVKTTAKRPRNRKMLCGSAQTHNRRLCYGMTVWNCIALCWIVLCNVQVQCDKYNAL